MPTSPRAAAAVAVAGLLLTGCGAATGASPRVGPAVAAEPVVAEPVALAGSTVDAVAAQVFAVGAERLAEAEAAVTARQDAKVAARDLAVAMAAEEAQRDAKRSARQAARELVEEQERLDQIAANKEAQEVLKELGYYDGAIDGDVGPKTEAAVEEFQEVNGLQVDGVIGDQTTAALDSGDAKPKPEPEPEPEEDEGDDGQGDDGQGDDEPVDDGEGVMLVSDAQEVLRDQGYYLGEIDGEDGAAFTSALVAFQKVNGISRDGSLGPETSAALRDPKQPSLKGGNSTRIEIDLSAQVIHLVKDGSRVRTMPTSSGNGEQYETSSGGTANAKTPVGDFVIERRIEGIREADLGILYDPLYFYKGWAIHGSNSVPPYEASHGCTRLTRADAKWLGAQVPNGTQVRIYGGTHTFIPTG